MFLFSCFFRFDVSHTPVIGRKRLLHLRETAPATFLQFRSEICGAELICIVAHLCLDYSDISETVHQSFLKLCVDFIGYVCLLHYSSACNNESRIENINKAFKSDYNFVNPFVYQFSDIGITEVFENLSAVDGSAENFAYGFNKSGC